jgi:ubiquinone/menaquinone biosynthesis C-methylase UbiE
VARVSAYDGLAALWEAGPGHVYRPLARALVAASPIRLKGRLVLDVGSGTGSVAEAALASGARVVAVDGTVSMVAFQGTQRWPGVAADALDLPFSDGAFDAATAGFLLNHLAPESALAELARTVRPGGTILASTWASGRPDTVKASIDSAIESRGWVPPVWYEVLKQEVEPISGDPERLAAAAKRVGLVAVNARSSSEYLGLLQPDAVVAYRLAMPHIAPWVAALDESTRAEVTRRALDEVAAHLDGWRPAVITLTCRVADPHPRRRAADRCKAVA